MSARVNILVGLDDFLHGRGRFAVETPASDRLSSLFLIVLGGGAFYGAVMASFTGHELHRLHQLLYVAAKVPLLLLVTFGLCLPSFFVINTVAGLRKDFGDALRAVVATQSCVAVVLASLAPITLFFYLTTRDYTTALHFNGLVFAVASLAAQRVLHRYYRPLIQRSPRHRLMMRFWFGLYVFVAIQMAWVLRPFIGHPALPVSFFRAEPWGNAYVEVLQGLMRWVER
jgi:hypothetical protein